jgi:hypothetical protein
MARRSLSNPHLQKNLEDMAALAPYVTFQVIDSMLRGLERQGAGSYIGLHSYLLECMVELQD